MKVYTIRQLITELKRDKQSLFYKELRESLGYDGSQLSRRINKTVNDSIDFKGSDLPFICATLAKALEKKITIEDLYVLPKKVSSR